MSATYLIAGGGTGGHIFPAIAIGEALMAQKPGSKILFVGTKYGMEKTLIPKMGYPLLTLPIRGLLGKGLLGKLAMLWRMPASFLLSLYYLIRYRPKAVIGVGGYASGPMLFTAALIRKPTVIQEQNAFPGLTNRLCSKVARLACLGFAEAGPLLSCPWWTTGNPVRPAFKERTPWSPARTTILILGGSQGARALNQHVPELLAPMLEGGSQLRVVHQAGKNKTQDVQQLYGALKDKVEIVEFIDDVAALMDQVRLVICRAGASTISELTHLKIPAVLVPFPGATHDHQTHNAKTLAQTGAGWLVAERELPAIGNRLRELCNDTNALQAMVEAYPPATQDSAALCAQAVLGLEEGKAVKPLIEELKAHVSKN